MSKHDLAGVLAEVLPEDVQVNARHISTPPIQCEAIFSAPPGEDPETTFCENHFLAVSINRNKKLEEELLVFGVEVLVYTTDRLTTLFVSKADSTGYLHLLAIPPRSSLLRLISTTFLSYLVRARQRPGVRLVVSLFARAQNQYLFPSSSENPGKHVLDDRGLIKWWCRVFDPILREYEAESQAPSRTLSDQAVESMRTSATAYLIVPGCDQFETRAFFPNTVKSDDKGRPRWINSYPLRQICKTPGAPPRCLVPRFPDDPKARFLADLDGELPAVTGNGDCPKPKIPGQWRSVRSLDQFWEMMSFRQECSAGRLVGFLWLVVNPPGLSNEDEHLSPMPRPSEGHQHPQRAASPSSPETTPEQNGEREGVRKGFTRPDARSESHLHGNSSVDPVHQDSTCTRTNSHPFCWPEIGRGEIILTDSDYKNAQDFLLRQDFENEDPSIHSTMTWIREVSSLADILWWGWHVTGKRMISTPTEQSFETNSLMSPVPIRKRRAGDLEDGRMGDNGQGIVNRNPAQSGSLYGSQPVTTKIGDPTESSSTVNLLNANFIRKKRKT